MSEGNRQDISEIGGISQLSRKRGGIVSIMLWENKGLCVGGLELQDKISDWGSADRTSLSGTGRKGEI
jgi:hypothetical protein